MENWPAAAAMLRQSLRQLSLHTRGEGFTNITTALLLAHQQRQRRPAGAVTASRGSR
jgi:hypothetical protein